LPNYGNTASVLSRYYNFPPQNGTAPTIAIISLGGTFLTSDLQYYWQTVLGLSKYPTVKYVDVGGVTNAPNKTITTGDGSEENTLDLEIAGGICPKGKLVIYWGPNTTTGFYNTIQRAIYDTVNKPAIISISWGAPEAYFSPNPTMTAYNQLFALASQPICVASGDNGSSDGITDGKVHIDFPSCSPQVVACGGTSIRATETTWSWNPSYRWGTGGGVSGFFGRPNYQVGIVAYPSGVPVRRATPDMALNADPLTGWTIYFNKKLYVSQFGGTSCVSPAMAGLLGLMNLTYRSRFLPNLYNAYKKNKLAFKDIKTGSNNSTKIPNRYNAGTGFDMCTGLGSLNGTTLFNTLKSFPI
jgi:kumamolisin